MKFHMSGPKRHKIDEFNPDPTLSSIELECLSSLGEEE